MRRAFAVLIAAIGVLLGTAPLSAHHSFAAEFDVEKPITVQGTITKVEMTNPHGWIHINVRGEDGRVTNWAIETGAPATLIRNGGDINTLRIGTEIVVDGWLARDGTPTVNGQTVAFTDGRSISAGSSNPD